MTVQTILQLTVMTAVGALLHYWGAVFAAGLVWTLAVVFAGLALFAPSVHATSQELVEHLAARLTTYIGLGLLSLVYWTLFVFGALALRTLGRDPLGRRLPAEAESNWTIRAGYGADPSLYEKPYTRPHRSRGDEA